MSVPKRRNSGQNLRKFRWNFFYHFEKYSATEVFNKTILYLNLRNSKFYEIRKSIFRIKIYFCKKNKIINEMRLLFFVLKNFHGGILEMIEKISKEFPKIPAQNCYF